MRSATLVIACWASLFAFSFASVSGAKPDVELPSFEATVLTGEGVSSAQLRGQSAVLIVTPSRQAAASTRRWAKMLRKRLDTSSIRVIDVLAVDLPFFISTGTALEKARERIPDRYHDQTWLLDVKVLEKALSIPPDAEQAYVCILDASGSIVRRVHGEPNAEKVQMLRHALGR